MKKPYEFEIKARYAGLRVSERKVADTYLSWDKDFEELSLAALAEEAKVSQPSVMRFVKAMGFDGFKEFKYAILKARGEQEAIGEDEKNSAGFPPPLVYGYAISEGDSLEEMPGRIISHSGSSKSTVDAIRQARKSGASVLCLTNQENALIGKWADLLLCTENCQMLYGNAIFSRISEIAVVDMIYVGVILSDYKKYTERLDRSSRIVRKHGYEKTKK